MKNPKLWLALAASLFAAQAAAQAFPAKPLRMIVPFPPGGVTDVNARTLAEKLAVELGQPVVVENRAGASGAIGAEAGARAPADGYTLTMGNISTLAINTVTFAKLAYDPLKDFAPVSLVAVQPLIVAVHPSVPVQTLQELVALARSQPGKLNYGTAGSSVYLAVEAFNTAAGIRMNHIPYKGSAPAVTDLVGGQLQVLFDPFPGVYPQVRAGRVRALAVTTSKRAAAAPAIPTVAESGYAGFDVSSWQGVVVPAATPREVIERLNRDIVKVLGLQEVKDRFAQHSAEASPTTPEQFGAHYRGEIARWKKVAQDAGVKPE
jgi:tripartite-type tricarboxylate transporter receptor subunit TctC